MRAVLVTLFFVDKIKQMRILTKNRFVLMMKVFISSSVLIAIKEIKDFNHLFNFLKHLVCVGNL